MLRWFRPRLPKTRLCVAADAAIGECVGLSVCPGGSAIGAMGGGRRLPRGGGGGFVIDLEGP